MRTLADSVYLDSAIGEFNELPRAGSALENLDVYDASARELKVMADKGWIEILDERAVQRNDERLIWRLRFRRVR
jgi:hypothetical protein